MFEKSIELLNRAVRDELTAVHQYMYFHFHLDDQGYDLLSGLFRRNAIQEMGHVELLAERILFLKGDVAMLVGEEVKPVKEVEQILGMACQMEQASARDYNLWANECSANADSVSKKVFEQLVVDEEGHFAQFDNELDKVKLYGDRYLALQSIEHSKNISAGTPVAT
jgi:bacterioferritin